MGAVECRVGGCCRTLARCAELVLHVAYPTHTVDYGVASLFGAARPPHDAGPAYTDGTGHHEVWTGTMCSARAHAALQYFALPRDFSFNWRTHVVTTLTADVISAHPMLVHSHLRWDVVWQRPQQLCSRFARSREVLFVEEPQYLDDTLRPSLERTEPHANLHRVIPRLPAGYRDHETATLVAVRTLLLELIGATGALAHRFEALVQWFYSPMPAPVMIGAFGESSVVYDRMDGLAPFHCAPTDLVQRDRFLVARADVVFTTGRAITDALEYPDAERRIIAIGHARHSSWERIAAHMTQCVEETIGTRRRRRGPGAAGASGVPCS